ncbi:hypothetical protein I4U23_017418 [Adineta vaga]|nr:hypothetical protein I4U23_017418 [Adineta vaga]
MLFKVWLTIFFTCSYANNHFYKGHELIRVLPKTNEHLRLIRYFEDTYGVDRWSEVLQINRDIKMSLPKKQIPKIKKLCKQYGIDMKILNNDLEKLIQTSDNISKQHKSRTRRSIKYQSSSHLTDYLRYDQIVQFLNQQHQRSPIVKNFTSLFSIGQTHENRSIWTIRIGKLTARRNILVDCGIHAREFISPSTCLYMIDKLIDEVNNGRPSLLSVFNIYIIPLLNPDGYEYAQTERRMWRKNRAPNGYYQRVNPNCMGVDLNRNFGYHWMENGASTYPCSETYAGPYQDSEPETRSLQKFINQSSRHWDAYLTFHSYGQYWIYPWGFALHMPDDYIELDNKANIGSEALKRVNGTLYKIGSAANLLYESAGGSDDWAKGVGKIKYVYTVELRPSDDMNDAHAHFAFMLPTTFIEPVGQETYAGVKEFLRLVGTILFNHLTKTYPEKYQVYGLDLHIDISTRYQSHDFNEQDIKTISSIPIEKFIQCDITDRTKLYGIINELKIDIIIHLAAVLESCPDIEKISYVNIEGTRNIFEASNIRRIIYASSVRTVFGYLTRQPYLSIYNETFDDSTMLSHLQKLTVSDHPPLASDQTPGIIAYEQSKIIGEQMAIDMIKNHSKSIICVRIGWVNIVDQPGFTWLRTVWLSYRDACSFIDRALEAPLNISGIYFALSNNHRLWVDLDDAKRDLGYIPQDGAENLCL